VPPGSARGTPRGGDLGRVGAAAAANYLCHVAETIRDVRVGNTAIVGTVLPGSAVVRRRVRCGIAGTAPATSFARPRVHGPELWIRNGDSTAQGGRFLPSERAR
jgi:hypothetical protein